MPSASLGSEAGLLAVCPGGDGWGAFGLVAPSEHPISTPLRRPPHQAWSQTLGSALSSPQPWEAEPHSRAGPLGQSSHKDPTPPLLAVRPAPLNTDPWCPTRPWLSLNAWAISSSLQRLPVLAGSLPALAPASGSRPFQRPGSHSPW